MDYIVIKTEQIGIAGVNSPQQAIEAAVKGEGDSLAINYAANPRQSKPVIPGVPPQKS